MRGATAAYLDEANGAITKIESDDTLDEASIAYLVGIYEKAYESEGTKRYSSAIAARDKFLAAEDLSADPKELAQAIEKALDELCREKGKLMAFKDKKLSRELTARYTALSSKVDANVQELAAVKIMLANKELVRNINQQKTYLRLVKKTVNGMEVVVIEHTTEFELLPAEKQQEIQAQFMAVQAAVSLELVSKLDLKEDRDWNEGMSKFPADWQGSKAQLLRYHAKYQSDPEKMMQIRATEGVLQQIVKMEYQDAVSRLETMEGVISDEGGDLNIDGGDMDHQKARVQLSQTWKYLDKVEVMVSSGKYLNIDDIWKESGGLEVFDIKSEGVSFLAPFEQQKLLSEPDPVKRKANILKLARAAQKARLTRYAQQYFDMYFSDRIEARKSNTNRASVAAEFEKKNGPEVVHKAVADAYESEKRNWIKTQNRRYGDEGSSPERLAKWEAEYKSRNGNIETRIKEQLIDSLWRDSAKKSLHAEQKRNPDQIKDPIWNEAYGGHFGVAEDIDDSFFVFTDAELSQKAAELAVSIVKLEIAIAAGAISGGAATAAIMGGAAEVGLAATIAAHAGGFAVEGLVMHSTSVALDQGAAGFQDYEGLANGLAMTYATLGVLKGVSAGIGKLGKAASEVGTGAKAVSNRGFEVPMSKAARVAAEKETARLAAQAARGFVTPFSQSAGKMAWGAAKGALTLTGKSTLDSALLTGLTYGWERVVEGHTMSGNEVVSAFGDNMVTFMVMGAMHSVLPSAEGGGRHADSKEAKAERLAIQRSTKLAREADVAREAANKAKAQNKPNAPALEATAKAKEAKARTAEAETAKYEAPKPPEAPKRVLAGPYRTPAERTTEPPAKPKPAAPAKAEGSSPEITVKELTPKERAKVKSKYAENASKEAKAKREAADADPSNVEKAREAKQAEARAEVAREVVEKGPGREARLAEIEARAQAAEAAGKPKTEVDRIRKQKELVERNELDNFSDATFDARARVAEAAGKPGEAAKLREQAQTASDKYKKWAEDLDSQAAKATADGKPEVAKALSEEAQRLRDNGKNPNEAQLTLDYLERQVNKDNCDATMKAFKDGPKKTTAELGDARDAAARIIGEERAREPLNDPKKEAERQKQLTEMENLMYGLVDPATVDTMPEGTLKERMQQVRDKLYAYSESLDKLRGTFDADIEARIREVNVWGAEGRPDLKSPWADMIGPEGKVNQSAKAFFEAEVAKALERTGVSAEDRMLFNSVKDGIMRDLQAQVKAGHTRPEIVNQLVMDAAEAFMYQMKLSNQRQLGDHGAPHLAGNIQKSLEIYAANHSKPLPDGKFEFDDPENPGQTKTGNLQEAIDALPPGVRLMSYFGNIYHDFGYSLSALNVDVGVTGAHPPLSRIMIENNAALRELFNGREGTEGYNSENFKAFLEWMNSHDKVRTEMDQGRMYLPGNQIVDMGLMSMAEQLSDNSAVASGEKTPNILAKSPTMRATARDVAVQLDGFMKDRGQFKNVSEAQSLLGKLTPAQKTTLQNIEEMQIEPAEKAQIRSAAIDNFRLKNAEYAKALKESLNGLTPQDRALLDVIPTKLTLADTQDYKTLSSDINRAREGKKVLSAAQSAELARIENDPKLGPEKRAAERARIIDASSLTPEQKASLKRVGDLTEAQVEAITRMQAVQERWQSGIKQARAEVEVDLTLNDAQRKNALQAIKDFETNYNNPQSFNAQFLGAPTSMDLLRMGEMRQFMDGTSEHVFTLREGYGMDVAQYGSDKVVGQITKMPGDYIDGKIKAQLDSGKPFGERSLSEQDAFLVSMGLTRAEYNAAKPTDPAQLAEWEATMKGNNKDAAEKLRGIYLNKQGVGEWLKNPNGPLRIPLDPFDKSGDAQAGKHSMVFEAPARVSAQQYDAHSFTEKGSSTPKNLCEGDLPTTEEGYKSLYKNVQERLQTLRQNNPTTLERATSQNQEVKALEATLAVVEARFAAQEVSRALTAPGGVESAVESSKGLEDPAKFSAKKNNIRAVLVKIETSPTASPEIKAQAARTLEFLRQANVSNSPQVKQVQDAISTLEKMQKAVTEPEARQIFRPAA